MERSDGTFRVEAEPGSRTLLLSGELDMAYAEALTDAASPLMEQPGDVTFDLSRLSFIDSSGLLALLRTADRLEGGSLILRQPSDPVRRVLDLVELAVVSPRIVIDD
jgi:anti-sigma B factor antagonist